MVDAEGDGGDRVDQAADGPEPDRGEQRRPRTPLVTGPAGPPGAEDHHPFQADVDDARPLGHETAEPRQGDGQREHEHRRRCACVGHHLLAAGEPGHTEGEEAQQHQQQDETTAPATPGRGGRGRGSSGPGVDAHAATSCASRGPRARCSSRASSRRRATSLTMTTDRTMVPCTIVATDAGMPWLSRLGPARLMNENSSAAKVIPTTLLRPSSATAMPEKPSPAVKPKP